MSNKVKYSIYAFAVILLLGLGGILIKVRMDRQSILKNGTRTEGTVLDLTSEKRSKRKTEYRMKVGLFIDTKAPVADVPKPAGKESSDAMLDRVFKNVSANRSIGNYETLNFTISGAEYNKLKRGDRVKVAFLREKPDDVILLHDGE